MRTNYTLTEPDGTTTKLNEPGAPLDDADPGRAGRRRCTSTPPVPGWVVLSGSLPPGTPVDWYAELVARAARHRRADRRRHLGGAAAGRCWRPGPDAGAGPAQAQHRGARPAHRRGRGGPAGDPDATLAAVGSLHDRGVAEVLLTLGADGALLSTADGGLWSALPARDHRPQHRRRR